MFICKPFAGLLSISAHTGTHSLSLVHTPFLSFQCRALLVIFSNYLQKGLRVVNFIVWMCATKMELHEIKPSLSKQKGCRMSKVGLKRPVYFSKHAWEDFCSKKPTLPDVCGSIFPSTIFWKLLSWPELNYITSTYIQLSIWYDGIFFKRVKTRNQNLHIESTQWPIFFKSTYERQIKWHTYCWQLVVERIFYHLPFMSWLDEDVRFRS